MPLIIAKLLSEDTLAELNAAIDTYKAGAGAELLDTQRAMASDVFIEADADRRRSVVLFHAGADVPASGAKTADLQHIVVDEKGTIVELQAAIDAALEQVEQSSVGDAVTTTPAHVTSATGLFEAEDVGRIIEIAGVQKVISAYTSANDVTYDNTDGDFASGTGLTVALLGAEVVQAAHMTMKKDARAGGHRLNMLVACEGEAY